MNNNLKGPYIPGQGAGSQFRNSYSYNDTGNGLSKTQGPKFYTNIMENACKLEI